MEKPAQSSSDSESEQKSEISFLSILIMSVFIGLIVGAGIDKSHILPVAFISAIILLVNRKKISAREAATKLNDGTKYINSSKDYYAWPKLNKFSVTIAAVPYQDSIRQLIQESATNSEQNSDTQAHTLHAHLIPITDNPFDNNVVRVDICSRTIGYFNPDQARSFHRRLNDKQLSNQITTCAAALIENDEIPGKTGLYGARLDIEPLE